MSNDGVPQESRPPRRKRRRGIGQHLIVVLVAMALVFDFGIGSMVWTLAIGLVVAVVTAATLHAVKLAVAQTGPANRSWNALATRAPRLARKLVALDATFGAALDRALIRANRPSHRAGTSG